MAVPDSPSESGRNAAPTFSSDARTDHGAVTVMLTAAANGDPRAAADLLPLVYSELRRLAHDRMRQTPPGNTLDPTALVHEAYLRLLGSEAHGWKSRGHFFGAAALAMRDILVAQARRKAAIKRGGGQKREALDDVIIQIDEPVEDVIDLDAVLRKLESQDSRKAQIVMLRYFAGLSQAEVAAALDVSERTVEREWRYIKAWLRHELEELREQRSA